MLKAFADFCRSGGTGLPVTFLMAIIICFVVLVPGICDSKQSHIPNKSLPTDSNCCQAAEAKNKDNKSATLPAQTDGQKTQSEIDYHNTFSRAWNILRQVDCDGLLHGLPQRLGKAIVPSKREGIMWQGVDDGGSIELDIKTVGNVAEEIFVGFFSDSRWWLAPPVQMRRFSKPGRYRVDGLPAGEYYLGAMTGSLPVPIMLGVHQSWPTPVRVETGRIGGVQLLLSPEFKNKAGGHRDTMQKGFMGDVGTLDPTCLATIKIVDYEGKCVPFCRVVFVERLREDSSQIDTFHETGTDEKGYAYCGKINGPFTYWVQSFDSMPGKFAQRYQFKRFETLHHTDDRKIITVRWPSFPTGNCKVKGRIHDQYSQPLKTYYLTINKDLKGDRQSKGDHYSIAYKIPITDANGRFEIDHLESGTYTVMVRAFDYPAYVYNFNMGQFTIAEADNSTTEFALEVEAKELLYGRALYDDGSPVYPGNYMVWFDKRERRGFALSTEQDGSFRVCLSRQERKDLPKDSHSHGIVEISANGLKIGEVHIDELSRNPKHPAKIVFPHFKAGNN